MSQSEKMRTVTKSESRGQARAGAGSRDAMIHAIGVSLRRLDLETLTQLKNALSVKMRTAKPAGVPKVLQGGGLGDIQSLADGDYALDAITGDDTSQDWAVSDLLGAVQLAGRLNIATATLGNWRQAGRVIAFRKGPRNYVYPLRQFDRFGGPVEGLDQVVAQFATCEDAWEWLVTPNELTGSAAPLDHLKSKNITEVVGAAKGTLDFG